MAYPGRLRSLSWRMLMRLRSGSRPPCTMANKFCSVGREWALMQRSIQRVVLCVASSNLHVSKPSQGLRVPKLHASLRA